VGNLPRRFKSDNVQTTCLVIQTKKHVVVNHSAIEGFEATEKVIVIHDGETFADCWNKIILPFNFERSW
jgi:hypothetical protein